jgi:hypothetical protein
VVSEEIQVSGLRPRHLRQTGRLVGIGLAEPHEFGDLRLGQLAKKAVVELHAFEQGAHRLVVCLRQRRQRIERREDLVALLLCDVEDEDGDLLGGIEVGPEVAVDENELLPLLPGDERVGPPDLLQDRLKRGPLRGRMPPPVLRRRQEVAGRDAAQLLDAVTEGGRGTHQGVKTSGTSHERMRQKRK